MNRWVEVDGQWWMRCEAIRCDIPTGVSVVEQLKHVPVGHVIAVQRQAAEILFRRFARFNIDRRLLRTGALRPRVRPVARTWTRTHTYRRINHPSVLHASHPAACQPDWSVQQPASRHPLPLQYAATTVLHANITAPMC